MNDLVSFLPEPFRTIAVGVLIAGILVTFIAVSALFFIWLERKVAGRMQDRLGPTRVGGRFGWLQTLADGIKLVTKEDLTPTAADHFLFRLAPYIAFCAAFVGFVALPFGRDVVGQELQVAAFFLLAVLSSEVFGVILAGYASASKWSLFGGMREAAQMVSYEVPRALSVLVPVVMAGTLNLNTIGTLQTGPFWNWYVFASPFSFIAFVLFFICATASCKRAPFDLAEAESELVAGFHTEYSGLRWSFFFMAEYGSMFAVSGAATILFLGGWNTGLLSGEATTLLGSAGHLVDIATFIGKCWVLVFVMMWMRWSLPRLRIDQVMTTCLQYFLPIACVTLLGACVWQLTVPNDVARVWRFSTAFGSVLAIVMLAVKLLTHPLSTKRGELPGAWAGLQTPLMRSKLG